MASRTDGASVKADSQLCGGLPQVHLRSDGVEQFNCLSQTWSSPWRGIEYATSVCHSITRTWSILWLERRLIPDKNQRKFIAETYYLYREIYHQLTLEAAKHEDMWWNVYLGETLTCNESGEPIKVERIE